MQKNRAQSQLLAITLRKNDESFFPCSSIIYSRVQNVNSFFEKSKTC